MINQGDHPIKFFGIQFQVAAQQGHYLAQCFNKIKVCDENPEGPLRMTQPGRHRFKPFRCLLFHFSFWLFYCFHYPAAADSQAFS